MEPSQLQLVFNVVTITGLTSLASFCYLLKKENRRLAALQESRRTSPVSRPVIEQDIRAFAAGQRANWVEGMRQRQTATNAAGR